MRFAGFCIAILGLMIACGGQTDSQHEDVSSIPELENTSSTSDLFDLSNKLDLPGFPGHRVYPLHRIGLPILTWSLVLYEAKAFHEIKQALLEQTDSILEHELGWQKVGLNFTYDPDSETADILIVLFDATRAKICPGACMIWGDGDICVVGVEALVTINHTGGWQSYTRAINHELGHCFLGPVHFGDEIMSQKVSDIQYPGEEEIELVKERFNP